MPNTEVDHPDFIGGLRAMSCSSLGESGFSGSICPKASMGLRAPAVPPPGVQETRPETPPSAEAQIEMS